MKIGITTIKVFSSPLFYGFILIIYSLIFYFPSLYNGFFCWDDKTVALAPVIIHMTFAGIVHLFFSFHVGLYHPLTSFSFMLDYSIGNGSPWPFHITNLILHICNILLLFVLLIRLTRNLRISFITCLLFAAHPMHIESIAWITSRKDLMFTFFSLLSITFYTDYTDKRQKVIYYFLVMFCVIFALLSKIQAVTLPFIFLLIDYFKGKSWKLRLIMEKVPFFLLCIFFGILNIIAQQEYGYISYGYHFSIVERAILMIYSISQYFIKILFPYPLSIFYPFPFKPRETIPLELFYIPCLLILGLAILLFRRKRCKRQIIFGLLFFFLNIIIVSGVSFYRDAVIADRYTYISSAGIMFVIAVIADDLLRTIKKYRIPVICLLVTYIAMMSLLTFQRIVMWNNPEILFRNALSINKNSDIILNTLATQEIESGKYKDAIYHLDNAIMISPDYTDAYFNRGIAYGRTGNLNASIRDLTHSIKINPIYYEAYFARGNAYMKSNDLQPAFDDFTIVIRLDPDHFGAFQNRAIVRGNMGDFAGAIEDLNVAISLNPGFAASYYLRGIALFNTGGNGRMDLYKSLSMGYMDAKRAIEYYCK